MRHQYEERFYRDWMDNEELCKFQIRIEESDLMILCDRPLVDQAHNALGRARSWLEKHVIKDPLFLTRLDSHPLDSEVVRSAPELIQHMIRVTREYDVGPMASVAGMVAQFVGQALLRTHECQNVIVENGGDIYIRKVSGKVRIGLYAGEESPFSNKVHFIVNNTENGLGVCTSSRKVGPSLSFGNADAVVTIAQDAALADAAATAVANRIKVPDDVALVVQEESERGLLDGLIACCGDKIAFWGNIELV